MGISGFKLDAQEGERLRFGEVEILVKATAQTTGGAFSIFEESSPVDTPLHVHEHEDERARDVLPGGPRRVLREPAEAERNGTLGAEAYAGAAGRYGITWLGE